MKKTFLILITSSFLLATSCSKSDTPSTPTGVGGGANTQYAKLTMKVDGRTFISEKAFGLYTELNNGGTIMKSVSFGHNAEVADEAMVLQFGSGVTVGSTHIFYGKAVTSSGALDQAIYKKPNTSSALSSYLVSPLSSTAKSKFTYKVVRIFDNAQSTTGKSVEFDFSGVLYKGNDANDSVVITDGTLRY
jgi:hypothetical protein